MGCAVDFLCRLLHLKIISLKKPLQIGLCNKAESDYYSGLGKTTVHSTSTTSIGTVNTPTNNINVEGTDNNIDITSELLNEAPVNSNTNQNPQRCLNLSNRPGESQC
ncbi:hypothetical protein [Acinetobacter sp. YH16052]|uniref:hypothetical protein n=1 Tax=Acinetobacter sp. YH16052 TaxID=2601191 RepID=UPI0035A072B9